MTNDEYMDAQRALLLVANILAPHDLAAFVARIDTADAVGPIVDPTLYRKAAARARGLRALAVACQKVQGAADELRDVVRECEP